MRVTQAPLRAAFWAMATAVALSLFLALSDPQSVRLSILASKHSPPLSLDSPGEVMIAERDERRDQIDGNSLVFSDKMLFSDELSSWPSWPTPDLDAFAPPSVAASSVEPLDRESRGGGGGVPVPPPLPTFAKTRVVSVPVGEERARPRLTPSMQRPAMPIVAPSSLTGNRQRGEFIELPPPPGMEDDPIDETPRLSFSLESSSSEQSSELAESTSSLAPEFDDSATANTAELARLQIEADVLELRRELQSLTETQRTSELVRLQEAQDQLLQSQQMTANRLDELTDRLDEQTTTMRELLQRSSMRVAVTKDDSIVSEQPLARRNGVTEFSTTPEGHERFSLLIEGADVSEVLERLGRWSRESRPRISTPSTEPAAVNVKPQLRPVPDGSTTDITPSTSLRSRTIKSRTVTDSVSTPIPVFRDALPLPTPSKQDCDCEPRFPAR